MKNKTTKIEKSFYHGIKISISNSNSRTSGANKGMSEDI
jgi:hypothetical protein